MINVLSRKRCPSVYFSGELKYLPEAGGVENDIRVLFLDINLVDDTARSDKQLRATLVPVLARIISENNYPYVLVYWSRNEKEHDSLVREIFETDLSKRKPIEYISQDKSLYFDLSGEKTKDFDTLIDNLFNEIEKKLTDHQAYKYLIDWENQVHASADKTLQGIFNATHTYDSWSNNAAFLINKLGEAYAGKDIYKNQPAPAKVVSSFQAFNNVFYDTLEYSVANFPFKNASELEYDTSKANAENIYSVNRKLLLSDDKEPLEYSGSVLEIASGDLDDIFKPMLNECFNKEVIEKQLAGKYNAEQKKEMLKEAKELGSKKRDEIRQSWKKIFLIVTPLCDYVQGKKFNNRVVKGFLIKSEYSGFMHGNSEAILVSPKFKLGQDAYLLVLNFRYFFTAPPDSFKSMSSLFRIRQQLLSEIQSKLARHISRQGVLFLDDY